MQRQPQEEEDEEAAVPSGSTKLPSPRLVKERTEDVDKLLKGESVGLRLRRASERMRRRLGSTFIMLLSHLAWPVASLA